MIKKKHYLDKKMKFSKFMLLGALGVALLTATSCGTPKDVAYFQDLNNNPDTVITLQNKVITVKPTDKNLYRCQEQGSTDHTALQPHWRYQQLQQQYKYRKRCLLLHGR